MIENSIKKVEKGVSEADQTANALQEVTETVDKVSGLVAGIASASATQLSPRPRTFKNR